MVARKKVKRTVKKVTKALKKLVTHMQNKLEVWPRLN